MLCSWELRKNKICISFKGISLLKVLSQSWGTWNYDNFKFEKELIVNSKTPGEYVLEIILTLLHILVYCNMKSKGSTKYLGKLVG